MISPNPLLLLTFHPLALTCACYFDLRPTPSVEGYTTQGGYSYRAVKPIALAKVAALSKQIKEGVKEGKWKGWEKEGNTMMKIKV